MTETEAQLVEQIKSNSIPTKACLEKDPEGKILYCYQARKHVQPDELCFLTVYDYSLDPKTRINEGIARWPADAEITDPALLDLFVEGG